MKTMTPQRRADIARFSHAAADTFTLGGDAHTNLFQNDMFAAPLTVITLDEKDGRLCFAGEPLLCLYREGDCDLISWPAPNMVNLVSALYDMRECAGPEMPYSCQSARLPDGSIVEF